MFANPSRSPAVTYEIEGFDPSRFNDIHALLHVGADLLYASRIAVGRGVILIPCGVITHAGNHTLMVAHTNGTIIALNSIQVFKLPFASAYSYLHIIQYTQYYACESFLPDFNGEIWHLSHHGLKIIVNDHGHLTFTISISFKIKGRHFWVQFQYSCRHNQ